jgi:hypothetical protein
VLLRALHRVPRPERRVSVANHRERWLTKRAAIQKARRALIERRRLERGAFSIAEAMTSACGFLAMAMRGFSYVPEVDAPGSASGG